MKLFFRLKSKTQAAPAPEIPKPGNMGSAWPKNWNLSILALLLGVGILGVFHVSGKFLPPKWILGCFWLIPWLFLLEKMRRSGHFGQTRDRLRTWAPLIILAMTLFLMLFSSAALHKWFFFLKWAPDAYDVVGFPFRQAAFILLTAFLTPFLLTRRSKLHWLVLAILLASQVACFHALMKAGGGHALARDDHPSMMFRLWEVSETWPQMLNYNPFWNAGVIDYAGMASGVYGVGMVLKPFLAFHKIHEIYTPMVGMAFIVIAPFLAALSVRVAGGRGVAPWAAGILALGVSQHFFLWLLQYGTFGACFSTIFILPFTACVFRLLWLDRREWWLPILMVGSFVFLLMWPPGALMAGTVLLAALLNVRRWSWSRIVFLALCGILGLTLLYKTIGLLVFNGGQELSAGILSPAATAGGSLAAWEATFKDGWNRLISHLHEVNPILVVLGIAGAAVFPCRSVRWWFLPILLALAVMCGWGPLVRSDLEFGRMSIPLAFVAIVPASLAIERILRTDHFRLAVVRAALVSLLALTGWNVANIYAGRQRFFTTTYMGDKTTPLVDLIEAKTAPGSRALIAGPGVHGYGDGGHSAILPYLSGREMMACDYYHFRTSEVEYEYPPRPFRDRQDSLFEFMQNYNVSLVITRTNPFSRKSISWADRLAAEPERYRKIAELDKGHVVAFQVAGEKFSMFLKGDGRVEAAFNRIHVATTNPNERTVIKYNWQDGLRVEPPAQIRPYPIAKGFDLIEIVWNGRSECTIVHPSVW